MPGWKACDQEGRMKRNKEDTRMASAVKETSVKGFLDRMILVLVGLYFIMKPFYFWRSGLPQISDFLIFFSFLLFSLKSGLLLHYPKNNRTLFILSTCFFFYVVLVNVVWFVILDFDTDFLQIAVFFAFNIGVLLYFTMLHNRYKDVLMRVIYRGALLSALIQGAIFMASGGFQGQRNIGTFNNPNQLGYYGLLTFGLLIFTSQRIKVSPVTFLSGVAASIVLTLTSLSKAAMIAYAILIMGYLFTPGENKKLKRKVNMMVFLVCMVVIMVGSYRPELFGDNPLLTGVQDRVSNIGSDTDDSLAMRGYDRISEYPQYWIFGAGEGAYERFNNVTYEFHSTLGTVQVSYGIIGLLQFLFLLYYVLRRNGFKGWYILACLLIYGLAHNGLRNSMFWMLLSLYTTGVRVPSLKKEAVPKKAAEPNRIVYPKPVAVLQNASVSKRPPVSKPHPVPRLTIVPKKSIISVSRAVPLRIRKVNVLFPSPSWGRMRRKGVEPAYGTSYKGEK